MLKFFYTYIAILLHILEKIKRDHRDSPLFVFLRFIRYDIIRRIRKTKKSTIFLFIKRVTFFDAIQSFILELTVKHICGPSRVNCGLNEAVVVCLVRDGEPYIKSFMDHYFSLGVKHIFLLDNNSCDNTISMARTYDRVTIFQTKLPYKKYQFAMKRFLINQFCRGKWYICVDIDEFFDYPFSDIMGLDLLLEYLNKKSYTAVVGQMLDMFSDRPLLSRKSNNDDSIKELYKFYDISDICHEIYADHFKGKNIISNEDIKLYWGGVRKTLFGSFDWLSKHPLVFLDSKTKMTGNTSHDIYNVRVADFTCVLLHYKFLDIFLERTRRAVQEENYAYNSKQYKRYYQVLQQEPNIQFKREHAKELVNVNDLVENQFLVVSEDYLDWVRNIVLNRSTTDSVETCLFLERRGPNEA